MNGSGHRPLLFRWKLPPIGSNREEEPADRHESRRGELKPPTCALPGRRCESAGPPPTSQFHEIVLLLPEHAWLDWGALRQTDRAAAGEAYRKRTNPNSARPVS